MADEFSSPSLDARLFAARKQMQSGLPGRAADLRAAVDRFGSGDPAARDDIRRLAHKLRGTAGSHGMIALGEQAGVVEALATADGIDAELVASALALVVSIVAAAREAQQLEVAPSAVAMKVPSLAGLRLLAIDDDASTRKLLALTLGSMGRCDARVLEAPEEALALLETERFDLVIVDAMMPSITGIAFANEVRAQRHGATIPIVFLSAASHEELGWALPTRTTWLRKPFRPQELLESLVRWIGEHDDGDAR